MVRLELIYILGILFFLIGLLVWNVYFEILGEDKTKLNKILEEKRTRQVRLEKE
jgi:uncharacterized membrane protein